MIVMSNRSITQTVNNNQSQIKLGVSNSKHIKLQLIKRRQGTILFWQGFQQVMNEPGGHR